MPQSKSRKPSKKPIGKNAALGMLKSNSVERIDDPSRQRSYRPRVVAARPLTLPNGQKKAVGLTELWTMLFEMNEALPVTKKLTDAAIKKFVFDHFDPNQSAALRKLHEGQLTVNSQRDLYNRGRFNKGTVPATLSHRYNKRGRRVDGRTGKRELT